MLSLNGISFNRCLTPPNAVGLPVLCGFLMPRRMPLAPAHTLDGSCLTESTTCDLLQRNQEYHHWKDWPSLASKCNAQFWHRDCVRPLRRVYYSLVVWRFKPILSAGLRFHSHLSDGLRLRNYRAVAGNHKFSSRFSVFACFCGKQLQTDLKGSETER